MDKKKAPQGMRRIAEVVGTSAVILVVAGTVGLPIDILAAALIGASVVLLIAPRR